MHVCCLAAGHVVKRCILDTVALTLISMLLATRHAHKGHVDYALVCYENFQLRCPTSVIQLTAFVA